MDSEGTVHLQGAVCHGQLSPLTTLRVCLERAFKHSRSGTRTSTSFRLHIIRRGQLLPCSYTSCAQSGRQHPPNPPLSPTHFLPTLHEVRDLRVEDQILRRPSEDEPRWVNLSHKNSPYSGWRGRRTARKQCSLWVLAPAIHVLLLGYSPTSRTVVHGLAVTTNIQVCPSSVTGHHPLYLGCQVIFCVSRVS